MAEQIATLNYFDRCIHMVSIDDVLALFWPPPIAKEESAEQFSNSAESYLVDRRSLCLNGTLCQCKFQRRFTKAHMLIQYYPESTTAVAVDSPAASDGSLPSIRRRQPTVARGSGRMLK
jgi:hypothetical protein